MNTSTPDPLSAWATRSAFERLSTKTRLFLPRATCAIPQCSGFHAIAIVDTEFALRLLPGGSTSRNGRLSILQSH